MKLVMVTWVDAVSDEAGWKSIASVQNQRPPVVRSVGWVMKRTRSHLTLAASIIGDHCDGDVTIPIGMVKREQELAVRK